MKSYDVIVIGAGPGGYVAAIRAAQLGLTTALVERWLDDNGKPVLGGTCLNVGCIPSKALLDSSHHYEFIQRHAAEHGIIANASLDITAMQARKKKVVSTLTQGIAGLIKKNKIEWLQGSAQFVDATTISITAANGDSATAKANHFIIATGSTPVEIPPAVVDQSMIVDSTGALALAEVPERIGVIGAGVIGLELGSVWRRLGAEVVVLEALSDFLPSADRAVAKEAAKIFKRQGLDIRLGASVTKANKTGKKIKVDYKIGEQSDSVAVDKLIVAVGRKPNTEGLSPENAGVNLDQRGFIEVDAECRTAVPNIYAIGDCVRGPMLAHKASEEGVAVAERLAGQRPHIDFNLVPWVIYTWPEIAWVGLTEAQAKAAGFTVQSGSFPLLASGRARAMGDTDGLVKMVTDQATDQVLGVHIVAANASELISEAVIAMEFGASSEDIARTVHGHPSLNEATHEAALAVSNRAIHI